MRYWIVDSETTGVTNEDKVVEVAGFYCVDGQIVDHYRSFVYPGIPIPPEASAIHHITDKDVADAPCIEDAMAPFFDQEFDFVGAHNAAFDKRYMDFAACPWICTWKLSMKVYPDAPSYSNQVLRYWLGIPDPVHAGREFAHRALYDSEVTTGIFHDMLGRATTDNPMENMIKFSNAPVLLKKCNLNKHKGKLWKDVPRDYLDWILHKSSGWDENTLHTARYYYER